MAERLAIWNAALGHIGEGTVLGGLTDPGSVANEIRRHYLTELEAMLAEFPWRFAERVTTLTAYPDLPPGTQYAFVQPAGCLLVQRVSLYPEEMTDGYTLTEGCWRWDGDWDRSRSYSNQQMPWRLTGATDASGNDVVLLATNQPAAYVKSTKRIDNEAVFPPPFAHALGWRLGWAISFGITRDLGRRQECQQQMLYWTAVAQAQDQRQVNETMRQGEAIRGRL